MSTAGVAGDVTELVIPRVTGPARELLVQVGERIHRGQLLARLTWKDPELERQRQHAAAQVEAAESALALQAAKRDQARVLRDAQLAASGAVAREAAAVLRAQEAVAQSRRELDRLGEEARRLAEIRSPVDGQILAIRLLAIHGSEGTAQLCLLYRRPGPRASVSADRYIEGLH